MTNRDPRPYAAIAADLTAPQIAALRALSFTKFEDFEGSGHVRALSALVRLGLADCKVFPSARRNHSYVVYRISGRGAGVRSHLAK